MPSVIADATGRACADAGTQLHLLPGQYFFGRGLLGVHTLLGSCVAVTLWHPHQQVGGMCHFLLPRPTHSKALGWDARFGEDAIDLLTSAAWQFGAKPAEFDTQLYGGADMLSRRSGVSLNVGARNIELAWRCLDERGFSVRTVDVGDHVPRHVQLCLQTGAVQMRRSQSKESVA